MPNEKLYPPPKPTAPREAPWTEIEGIIDGLGSVATKLDAVLAALKGLPPPKVIPPKEEVIPPPIDGRIDAIVDKLNKIIDILEVVPGPPAPPEIASIISRLDSIIKRLEKGVISSVKPGFHYMDVGTTSAVVLDTELNRTYALLINDSDTDIYLELGKEAKLNQGIRLTPNGGYFSIDLINTYTGKIYGICSAANKRLLVIEAT